jgi:hypothetical protein
MYHAIKLRKIQVGFALILGGFIFLKKIWVVHRRTPSGPGKKVQKDEVSPGLPHPWFSIHPPPKSKVNKKELSRVHTSFVHSN